MSDFGRVVGLACGTWRGAVAAIVLFGWLGSAQAQDTLALMPGADYATARQALQAQGYQPLIFPRGGEYSQCIGSDPICSAYPEIVGCTGTGFNPCRFAFRAPDGGYLVGIASGETPEQLRLEGIAAANAEDSRGIENLLAGRPELADAADTPANREAVAATNPIEPPARASDTAEDGGQALGSAMFFGLIVAGLAFYMLPTIIAFGRRHRYRWPILGFNIGAGWSGIGWIWTLVWSVWPQGRALIDPVVGDAAGAGDPPGNRG